ncbi:MAG: ORF6C domain-containing protein [Sarcina sp.]
MSNLVIKGTQLLEGKEIKVIEGGFGENQKCMLVSDIAIQHEVEIKYINKVINNNINRFGENDLIDLKSSSLEEPQLINMGFTKMQVSKANNIFLLSERGYTKLVAMMDNSNEKKWEVMDKLIDGYFKMRETLENGLNQIKSDEDIMIYQLQEQKKIKEQLNQINNRALKNEKEIDNLPLLSVDSKEVSNCVKRKAVELLGGKKSGAYEKISKKVFSDMYRELWRQFEVSCIAAIKRKDLGIAKNIISNYHLPYSLEKQIFELNRKVRMADIQFI